MATPTMTMTRLAVLATDCVTALVFLIVCSAPSAHDVLVFIAHKHTYIHTYICREKKRKRERKILMFEVVFSAGHNVYKIHHHLTVCSIFAVRQKYIII